MKGRIPALAKALTLLDVYPVGSVYISTVDVSPGLLFGGSWVRIVNKFLLAASNPNGTVTYAGGDTGGRSSYKLSQAQLPDCDLKAVYSTDNKKTWKDGVLGASGSSTREDFLGFTNTIGDASVYTVRLRTGGSGESIDNMPPYLAVYMWKRTA